MATATRREFLAVCAATTLGGCSALSTDGTTTTQRKEGDISWIRRLDGFGNWHIQPVLADGVLYVPLHDEIRVESRLFALDAKTGETLWKRTLSAPTTNLAVAGSTLYVTSYDGILHAFE